MSPELLRLRVLSWKLSPGHARWPELAAVLAGWEWDVAALRGVPAGWPLPVSRALDAEFRYAPAPRAGSPEGSRLRRLLSSGPLPLAGPATGTVNAIVARGDRIASEWPPDARRARRTGLHLVRLACGVWVGNQRRADGARLAGELAAVIGDAALVLAGARAGMDIAVPGRPLAAVARGGEDGIWASGDLVPMGPAEVLAGGGAEGRPALAVTLEHRPRSVMPAPGPD